MKRPTTYCDTCESTVYADDIHTCHDAKALRAQQERERALTGLERAVIPRASVGLQVRHPTGVGVIRRVGKRYAWVFVGTNVVAGEIIERHPYRRLLTMDGQMLSPPDTGKP